MDFERLEQAWRSEANRPSEALQALLTEHLMDTLKTRRRTEALLGVIPIAAMTVFTILAGAALLNGDALKGWLGLALMGMCWIVIILAIWNGVRGCPRDTGLPMRDTLVARLTRNRREQRNFHLFWMLAPVFFFPMGLSIHHLQAEGRLDTPAGFQVLAVCGGALVASVGWNILRFFMALKPEQRRLEGLLREYEG